jgi:PAS domain S-box-containing protein
MSACGITDSLPVVIIFVDQQDRYGFANKLAEIWYAQPNGELIGKHIHDVHAKEFQVRLIPYQNRVLAGETVSGQEAIAYPDGVTRDIDLTYVPHLTEKGEVAGYYVLIMDITGRRQLEEQIRQSQKMEVVGQLTGGIAHDFNNILGIILGFVEIVRGRVKDDPDLVRYLEIALEGTKRGTAITKKLLSFASKVPGENERTDVNEFVLRMKELIATSLTPSIHLENHLADDLWPVEIDPGDFENAILNLSLNARDAMPEGGSLIIETANKVLDDHYVNRNPAAKAGEYVMISMSDNGSGMTDEIKEKLFEPFFTTKAIGQGTGLGLSMVYGFIERSSGHIKVYSEIGEGTTFRIFLPRAPEHATESEPEPDGQIELPRGGETILVVDDEEALTIAAVLYLEALGYNTLTAGNGRRALEILDEKPDIDLLFCDIIMPGELGGYQVVLAVRESHPTLKILLTSGFTKQPEAHAVAESRYLGKIVGKLLSKPYNHEELAFAVRRTLDADEGSD